LSPLFPLYLLLPFLLLFVLKHFHHGKLSGKHARRGPEPQITKNTRSISIQMKNRLTKQSLQLPGRRVGRAGREVGEGRLHAVEEGSVDGTSVEKVKGCAPASCLLLPPFLPLLLFPGFFM